MGELARAWVSISLKTDQLQKGLAGLKANFSRSISPISTAVKQMTGFDLATISAAGAVLGLAKVLRGTVNDTMVYAKQVKDLKRLIGATPEQASALIQVADDVRISYETMSTALEAAIRKGVAPTIEGIAKLSDEYLAIQDPIERSAFLMEKFGRSGAEMGALMELGSKKIREISEGAKEAGLVLG